MRPVLSEVDIHLRPRNPIRDMSRRVRLDRLDIGISSTSGTSTEPSDAGHRFGDDQIIVNLINTLQASTRRDLSSSLWNTSPETTNLHITVIYFIQTLLANGVAVRDSSLFSGIYTNAIELADLTLILKDTWNADPATCSVTGIVTLVSSSKQMDASGFMHQAWLIAYLSITLAASTTYTLMIASRVWVLERRVIKDKSRTSLCPLIMGTILDSGAIYSATLVTLVVLLLLKSWFQHVLLDSIPFIIALVFSIVIFRIELGVTTDGPQSPSANPSADNDHSLKSIIRLSTHHGTSQDSVSFSPSHFWPAQPDRSLPGYLPRPLQERQQQQRKNSKRSLFDFLRGDRPPKQGHYNLRSQLAHPSSYFRTSEEMGVDVELEVEIDEARWQQPKALPNALMLPRSERISVPLS
ncbi:hypothetical protein D9756_007172 [Leucocoprinus leucothites]|uniref:Transmembrane protein n=1 Tax=Leucocoprinus leucothites TaxID=201217 RepID=A0A8H5D5H1_9AGAR|nr:hypothetical protein D9756_007172 [Leucoagaricus leucothites]